MRRPRTIAALYVDPLGPYPEMRGVECWNEKRDAKLYNGPHPVVAHPPCGPWGRLSRFSQQDPDCGPRAVEQVRLWGGVLEHPAESRLWKHCDLPRPDPSHRPLSPWEGFTVYVEQVNWGHKCTKPTWLFCVGIPPMTLGLPLPLGLATHGIRGGKKDTRPGIGKLARRLTPPAFAKWLVFLARSVTRAAESTEVSRCQVNR